MDILMCDLLEKDLDGYATVWSRLYLQERTRQSSGVKDVRSAENVVWVV
jgi:hypothetical protein